MSLLTLTKKSPLGENLAKVLLFWYLLLFWGLRFGMAAAGRLPHAVHKVAVLTNTLVELEGWAFKVAATHPSIQRVLELKRWKWWWVKKLHCDSRDLKVVTAGGNSKGARLLRSQTKNKNNKNGLQGGNLLEVNAADLLAVAGDFADARATAWNEAHVLRGKGHIFLVG